MAYEKLKEGHFYHIYNRGIGGENIFKKQKHYAHFLKKYAQYTLPVMGTYAYCLLKNHFHVLVRIKTRAEQEQYFEKHLKYIPPNLPQNKSLKQNPDQQKYTTFKHLNPSRQIGHLCNSYAQSINAETRSQAKPRTKALFERPFERKIITTPSYYLNVVYYIHRNPQKHGFVADFRDYPHSSYHAFLAKKNTRLMREQVLKWFGGKSRYVDFHSKTQDFDGMEDWVIEL